MSAHTPGPWWPSKDSAGVWGVRTIRSLDYPDEVGGEWGAYVCMGIGDHTSDRTRGNEEANARLIAAAPDLLEALRDLMGWIPGEAHWHTKAPSEALERARAAIAKATGGAA